MTLLVAYTVAKAVNILARKAIVFALLSFV